MKWKEMNQWIKNEFFYSWKLKYLPHRNISSTQVLNYLKTKSKKRILKNFPTSQEKNLKK